MEKDLTPTIQNYPIGLGTLIYNVNNKLCKKETLDKEITEEIFKLLVPFKEIKLSSQERHHIINSLSLLQSIIEMEQRGTINADRYAYGYTSLSDHFKELQNL